jgi:hypothetical protein
MILCYTLQHPTCYHLLDLFIGSLTVPPSVPYLVGPRRPPRFQPLPHSNIIRSIHTSSSSRPFHTPSPLDTTSAPVGQVHLSYDKPSPLKPPSRRNSPILLFFPTGCSIAHYPLCHIRPHSAPRTLVVPRMRCGGPPTQTGAKTLQATSHRTKQSVPTSVTIGQS